MLKYFDLVYSRTLKTSNLTSRLKSRALPDKTFDFSNDGKYSFFSTTLPKAKKGIVLGVLKETYDIWERRAPLSPDQVQNLLNKYKNKSLGENCGSLSIQRPLSEIIIQPSSNRIFTDDEYLHAGAKISNDLSPADIILGVKRVSDENTLLPDKTYMFFAHVIKGQPENMRLMQTIIDKNIQLIDYECIRDVSNVKSHLDPRKKKEKRLVTFGKFAGIAGMIDTFQLIGKRLLASGYSTPFLNCPPAYMFHDVNDAKENIKNIASHIEEKGLSDDLGPLVFAFTGNGNVTNGALEIFKLLPHKMLKKEELYKLREQKYSNKLVYGIHVGIDDIVRRKGSYKDSSPIDKSHYYANPLDYEPIFHKTVAPFCNVIINGIYWDERFPRLLTKQNIHDLYRSGNKRIFAVTDISCDVNGSIEFLEKTTTVDKPHFEYLPLSGAITDDISSKGVAMLGVDILPSELPRDSTKYFGNALLPLLEKTIEKYDQNTMPHDSNLAIPFPTEVARARISYEGDFTPNFEYIRSLLKRSYRDNVKESEPSLCISMKGHLFDSGLINQALNVLDDHKCHFQFKECNVIHRTGDIPEKSSVLLLLSCDDNEELKKIVQKLHSLVDLITPAEASLDCFDMKNYDDESFSGSHVYDTGKTILILGAGRVASSLSEYLGRSSKNKIHVASKHASDAYACANMAKRGQSFEVDIENDSQTLLKLFDEADLVISLLPADLHPFIAEKCIRTKTNLVTASYESDDMKNLDKSFKDAGISVLNEVGLDPGMDHMSAMKIIHDIQERGGEVSSFKSVCGGLPSPEAANNPLLYKFSWSPMGVLKASRNDARYLLDGKVVDVAGEDLLENAQYFNAWPTLNLECLPNRNAIIYGKKYGIESAGTIFRGTLRYHGFSTILSDLRKIGLMKDIMIQGETWEDAIRELRQNCAVETLEDLLLAKVEGESRVARVKHCLDWLGITSNNKLSDPSSIVKSFCDVLEGKLEYQKNERDMVLMYHDIHGMFDDGVVEVHNSSLQIFGDEKMTAMSKTVGYTTAIAADLILDGTINEKGLLLPTQKDIYIPCLHALEKEGLKFDEKMDVHNVPLATRMA